MNIHVVRHHVKQGCHSVRATHQRELRSRHDNRRPKYELKYMTAPIGIVYSAIGKQGIVDFEPINANSMSLAGTGTPEIRIELRSAMSTLETFETEDDTKPDTVQGQADGTTKKSKNPPLHTINVLWRGRVKHRLEKERDCRTKRP